MTQDGRRGEQRLEFIKCGLGFGRPYEPLAFAKQVSDREHDTGVSVNEAAVEVCETEEYLDVEDRLGDWPFGDGADAFWVHGDAFGGDNKSKEADFLHVKLAFFDFGI